jgi:hypothetical protein
VDSTGEWHKEFETNLHSLGQKYVELGQGLSALEASVMENTTVTTTAVKAASQGSSICSAAYAAESFEMDPVGG